MNDKLTISSEILKEEAEKLGVSLTPSQIDQLLEFCLLLRNFNEHTNLVSNCEPDVLLRNHLLDSLSLCGLIKIKKGTGQMSLIDIGSGGGFPGLVLAIAVPSLKVALVDSVAKKCRFLSEAITALSLAPRVSAFSRRAEAMAHERKFRQQFDYATCRAVGQLSTVLELTLPFLKKGGMALIQRSATQSESEAKAAELPVGKLKARLNNVVYPDENVLTKARAVLLFEQLEQVPKSYPRAWPQPKAAPLF